MRGNTWWTRNAEIGQLVTNYVEKKREIACLRSAINRCAQQLETLGRRCCGGIHQT